VDEGEESLKLAPTRDLPDDTLVVDVDLPTRILNGLSYLGCGLSVRYAKLRIEIC